MKFSVNKININKGKMQKAPPGANDLHSELRNTARLFKTTNSYKLCFPLLTKNSLLN